ncbi:cytochrome c [Ferrovibrio sp.]|jgi:sulfide dehydrogenase cytochrome subunit|uniref:c-type cytochrome n=1 Tax=Ferrovibrio sp. TaxID=1917215 RepID=UPI0035B33C92
MHRFVSPWLLAAAIGLAGVGPAVAQQRNNGISDITLAAQTCNVCHGSASYISPTMPAIHGHDANALYTALVEFKTDKRPYTIMGRIARGYSDEQLKALADYLAKN